MASKEMVKVGGVEMTAEMVEAIRKDMDDARVCAIVGLFAQGCEKWKSVCDTLHPFGLSTAHFDNLG